MTIEAMVLLRLLSTFMAIFLGLLNLTLSLSLAPAAYAQDDAAGDETADVASDAPAEKEANPDNRPKAPPKGTVKVFLKDPKAPGLIQGITVNESVDIKVGEEVALPKPSPSPSTSPSPEKNDEKKEGEKEEAPAPAPSPNAAAEGGEPPVQQGAGSPANPIAVVDGNFDRKGWQLFQNDETLWLTRDKKFKLEMPVYSQETEFEIIARGKGGEEERSRYVIQFENWHKFSGDPRVRRGLKKDGLWVGGSLGSYSYTETRANPAQNREASQLALAVWGHYRRTLSPRWDARGVLSFTLLPVSGNPSGYRFLSLAVHAGYQLYKDKEWQVHGVFGPRHLRMMTDGSFGFSNATGFQILPTVTRKLANGSTIQGYVGYSSVALYYGIFPGNENSELTIGFSYDFIRTKPAKPIRVHLDYSKLSLDVDDAVLNSSTITLGASIAVF